MKKGEQLARNTERRKTATELWLRIATDYNAGLTPAEIGIRYVNPKTGKPYHVKSVYRILRQLHIRLYS